MKPVYQTILEPPHGNCLQACVATLLHLKLDDVPNFNLHGDDWNAKYIEFLEQFNLYPVMYDANWYRDILDDDKQREWHEVYGIRGYHLITGTSPRSKTDGEGYHHCVVGYNLETVFDPYPNSELPLERAVRKHTHYEFFALKFDKGNEQQVLATIKNECK